MGEANRGSTDPNSGTYPSTLGNSPLMHRRTPPFTGVTTAEEAFVPCRVEEDVWADTGEVKQASTHAQRMAISGATEHFLIFPSPL